jgi:hypothetical protein
VGLAAVAHSVRKVELRGDCCICVTGVDDAIPSHALPPASADAARDQTTRMLAFAAALDAGLRTVLVCGRATAARMGIATGEVAFLVGEGAAGPAC